MKNFRSLTWIPNAITLCRSLLGIAAFVAVLRYEWAAGFWLLISALATDFFDGLAARKLGVTSTFGEHFDAWTDSFVGILGMVSLSITGHLSWWITEVVLLAGMLVGSDRFFNQPVWKWRAVTAVACLFIMWIGIVWYYASIAFGWSWLYVPATVLALAACGVLKRRRIRAWWPVSSKNK